MARRGKSATNSINMSAKLVDNVTPTLKKIVSQLQRMDSQLNTSGAKLLEFGQQQQKLALKQRHNTQKRYQAIMLRDEKMHNMQMELEAQKHANKMEEIYARQYKQPGTSGTGTNFADIASKLYIFKEVANSISKMFSATNKIMEVGDTVRSQKARLSLYNTSGYSTDVLYNLVASTALNTRSNLTSTADLTNRLLAAGVYQGPNAVQSTAGVVGLINKSLIAGGGTTQEVNSVLLQLSQALSQGQLQGQELRAIRQYAPYMGNVIVEGLNKQGIFDKQIVFGDLKELGAEGELTTERILKAFELMSDQINADFEKMPKTWGQGLESMKTLFSLFTDSINQTDLAMGKVNETMWNFVETLQSSQADKFWTALATSANLFFSIVDIAIKATGSALMWLAENIQGVITVLSVVAFVLLGAFIALNMPLMIFLAGLMLVISFFSKLGINGSEVLATLIMLVVRLVLDIKSLANVISGTLVSAFYAMASVAVGAFSQVLGVIADVLSVIDNVSAKVGKPTNFSTGFERKSNYWNSQSNIYKSRADVAGLKATEELNNLFGGNKDAAQAVRDSIIDSTAGLKSFGANLRTQGLSGIGGTTFSSIPTTNGAIDTNVKGGSLDEVSLSDEDITLLRDLVARDYLINVSTTTPVMNNTFGDIRETADINKILDELDRMVDEELATSVVYG